MTEVLTYLAKLEAGGGGVIDFSQILGQGGGRIKHISYFFSIDLLSFTFNLLTIILLIFILLTFNLMTFNFLTFILLTITLLTFILLTFNLLTFILMTFNLQTFILLTFNCLPLLWGHLFC